MKRLLQALHLQQPYKAKTRKLLLQKTPKALRVVQLELMSRTTLKKMR